jgi:hypothetical protein
MGDDALVLDYDEHATVGMLAALISCPKAQQLDTLVAVFRAYIELIDKAPSDG